MWRLFVALVALVAVMPCSAFSQVDFCDEFDGSSINDSIWTIETGDWTVSDGKLIGYWNPSDANNNVGNILLTDQAQPGGDFTMDIDGVVLPYGNVENSRYITLYSSFQNKYSIGFNPELNEIHIFYCFDGTNYYVYAYDNSSGILNASVGDVNHAMLIRESEQYSFYINGHYIHTFEDEYFNGDVKLGLSVYGTTAFERVCVATSGQSEPFFNECHDLDDNLVPEGWTQVIFNGGPGVHEGAFRGFIGGGTAFLRKKGTMPPGAVGIRFEYDANIAYSLWGLINKTQINLSSGVRYVARCEMSEVHNDMVTRAKIGRYGSVVPDTTHYWDFPFETTNYHYTATFYDGLIEYKAERLDDGAILFDLSVEDEYLDIDAIDSIAFAVKSKTDNNAWMDNLCVGIIGGVVQVPLDIKPGSCPNPLNVKGGRLEDAGSRGGSNMAVGGGADPAASEGERGKKAVLPIAILGTDEFDVALVDATTVVLAGVPAVRWNYDDVTTPVADGAEECECNDYGPDGFNDMTLKFDKAAIIAALGEVYDGDVVPLTISGQLVDGVRPSQVLTTSPTRSTR
jgi:hypothetical protein